MFFNSIEDLQAFIPINTTGELSTYTPHLRTAYRKYILPYLSVELANKVEKHWQKENMPKAIESLLPHIQESLAHFAFVLALPSMQVQVSEAGVHRIEDNTQLTAYKYQVEALTHSHTEQAWFAIDELLKFLEKNERDYAEWASSESSVILKSNFIQTADEFTQYADIQESRRLFYALKPTMRHIEESYIYSALGASLYKILKDEVKKDRIVPRHVELLNFIKPAVALLTLAHSSTDLVLQWYGNKLLPTSFSGEKEAKKIELHAQILQTWRNEKENAGMSYLNRMKKHIMQYAPLYPEYPIPTEKINNNGAVFSF